MNSTRTARTRLRIVSVPELLEPEQWDTLSLCAGWTAWHVSAHLLQPMLVGFTRFFATSLSFRADTAETGLHNTHPSLADCPTNAANGGFHVVVLRRPISGQRI